MSRRFEKKPCNKWNLLAAVATEVEGEHAAAPLRSLQYLRVTQRAHGVLITGTPVILHARSGEIVVFRGAFVAIVERRPAQPVGGACDDPDSYALAFQGCGSKWLTTAGAKAEARRGVTSA